MTSTLFKCQLIVGSLYPRRFFVFSFPKISSGGKATTTKKRGEGGLVATQKGGGWKQGRVAKGMVEIRHVEMDADRECLPEK